MITITRYSEAFSAISRSGACLCGKELFHAVSLLIQAHLALTDLLADRDGFTRYSLALSVGDLYEKE